MWALACLSMLLLAHQQQAAQAVDLPTQAAKPTFIAVGDGLTEGAFSRKHNGWGLLMQERYVRKADVVNRGFGGYFTSWFTDYMLDDLFDVGNPTFVILFLGTKDTLTQAVSGNHYISPEQFGQNVDRIIQKAKEAGVQHFLIVTPPPVCEACKKNTPKPWDRENAHSQLYVDQLQALATKHKAGFLNIFKEWQKDPQWYDKLLLPDGLHLSSEGNELLWQQMQGVMATQVPAVAWENVPLHFPLMDAIDKDNPSAAFDKVKRGPSKKALREDGPSSSTIRIDSSSSTSSTAGLHREQGQQQQQQQRSSANSLAAQGAGWLLLGVAVTAWQLFHAH